jgi:PAS domain S-box-containing protein
MIRVLYVDDESTILELCKIFLERSGDFTVTIATSAPEAIRILGQERFDTIVSDYQMPEMNGIEFLRHLKDMGDTTPVIIFTGKGREEVVIEALNAGAAFYLQKGGGAKSQFAELSHKIKKVVEGRQSEEALRKNETLLRGYFNLPLHGIAITSPDKRWLEANDRICSMLGYTRDELLNKNWAELTHPDDLAADEEQFNRVLSGHIEQYTMDKRFIHKDDRIIWTNITIGCIRKSDGNVDYIIGLMEDITERKQMEEALRESETRYREFFTISRDSIFITSPEGRWIDFNDALVEMFGYASRKEMFEVPVQDIYADPKERSAFTHHIEREGYVKEYPVQLKQKDGTVIDTIVTTVPVRNPDGSTKAFIGTIRDVTKQKRAEQETHTLQQFQQSIIDNANVWISVLDPKGTILVWNTTAEQITGYLAKDVIGKNTIWKQLYPDPVYRKKVVENILDIIKKNTYVENFETRIRTMMGDEKIIWWNTQPLRDASGKPVQFIAIGRDNTERRQAEERIKELRQFEESVIKNANIWISVLDGKGNVSIWNRAAEKISGYKAREVIGKNTIWSRIYPDKEYRHSVTVKIKEIIGAHNYLENFETRIRTKDGQERIIWWNTRALQDVPGIDETFIAIGKDVTEQRKLSDAVQLANKKLNLLASITRHDINNQLMALLAYLELCEDVVDSPAQQAEYIKKVQHIARTIERQIDLTKDYQEMGIAAPVWQNVDECIRKAITALPMRSVHVEVDLANPEVYADPLLEKVFYNLIDNALRYGGADLKTIRVSSQEIGAGLQIVCDDDGVGISVEDKKKLFTRGFGRHTGLGLFLSREILGITGITITENGTSGKGARFEIAVPKGMYRFKGIKGENGMHTSRSGLF